VEIRRLRYPIFDIGGNKFRLIAHVSHQKGKVYVLKAMTRKRHNSISRLLSRQHPIPSEKRPPHKQKRRRRDDQGQEQHSILSGEGQAQPRAQGPAQRLA
jgi:hypothetical protein